MEQQSKQFIEANNMDNTLSSFLLEIKNFHLRYHLEFLLSSKKIPLKILTPQAKGILISAESNAEIEQCILFLDKVTHQRPNWDELKERLATANQQPQVITKFDW